MTRSLRLLDGKTITHSFIQSDDLPEQVTPEQIESGLIHALLPSPGQRDPSTVTICITSGGRPVTEFLSSCIALEHSAREFDDIGWTVVPNGPYMDQGRNKTIFRALASTDSEWLMTLDDDLGFTPADVRALVKYAIDHGLHVVGGIYGSPHNGRTYAVAYRHDDTNLAPDGKPDGYIDLTIDEIDAMDPDDPSTCQVAAVGTGFLLIHRSVLEMMRYIYAPPQPWFAELTVPMPDPRDEYEETIGTHLGEDLTFCRRLWAIGIPVHVAPHIRLVHYKTLGITLPPHPRMT